ncbi:MAG: hypothetical protein U0V70_01420 [Terriglobia bacterium]
MHNYQRLPFCISLILVLALGNSLRAQGANVASTSTNSNLAGLKKEITVFQGVLDTTVRQNLQMPFPLLGSTRGTYLPDYGAVFHLEVNVYQIRTISPFDLRPHTQKELDDAFNQMVSRAEMVKGLVINSIAEYGTSMQLLKPEENLSVVVYFFGGDDDGKRSFPSQMVLNVKKSVLQEYKENKLSLDGLKQNIRITQF